MKNEMSLAQFHKELQMKASEHGIPVFGGFELTPRCNLSCKMCYVKYKRAGSEPDKKELTAKQWIEIGKETRDNGALTVFITGGEPLIRNDFKEIYEAFCRLGFRITLFTNGTLITDAFAKWLSSIPPSTVDVTLYGASENTYLNLCGSAEAYGMTISGIELLQKFGINTRIKTTVVKTNLKDYSLIKEFAHSHKLEFLGSSLIHGNRDTGIDDCVNERLSPEEIYNLEIESVAQYDCKSLDLKNLKESVKNIPALACSAAKNSFFVNWKGELTPCPLFSTPITKPLEIGFEVAWDMLKNKVREIKVPVKCRNCDERVFCPVCPPRLYLETGSFEKHSDYLCELAKSKEKFVYKFTK